MAAHPVETLKDYRSGSISRDELAASVYPLIKRLSKVVAWNVGGVDADDLCQELWLIFEKSVVHNFDAEMALEPYLLVIARNTAYLMRSKVRETAETNLIDYSLAPLETRSNAPETMLLGNEEHEMSSDQSMLSDIDRRIGILEIRRRIYNNPMSDHEHPHDQKGKMLLPCVKETDTPAHPPAHLPAIEKRPQAQRVLSPEHQELVSIRKMLGMSQARFAEELGIGVPRLASYEYGRAESIPEWVMQAARDLRANSGSTQESARKRYEQLEMPQIIEEWARSLNVPYEDNSRLAALLGTTVPTLTRWKNRKTRPSLQSLLFHEQMVEQVKLKLAKQNDAVEVMVAAKKRRR